VSYRRHPGNDSYREIGCYAAQETGIVKMWESGKIEFTHNRIGGNEITTIVYADGKAEKTVINADGTKDTVKLTSKDAIDGLKWNARNALRLALRPQRRTKAQLIL
jgi:hypothetical protein